MNRARVTLVIGGCRSGKSDHALTLAEEIGSGSKKKKSFVATCVPGDDEMRERVSKHQDERPADWQTIETPLLLTEAIRRHGPDASVMLIDCLTLWMNNIFMQTLDESTINRHIDRFAGCLENAPCPLVIVSNEIGYGLVPDNPLSRQYRDAIGRANQAVARKADAVILTVAGIPHKIK